MAKLWQKIKNLLARRFDKDKSQVEPRPYRDWRVLLIVFAVLVVVLIGLGLLTRRQLVQEGGLLSPVAGPVAAVTIDLKLFQKVLAQIGGRAKEFDRLFQAPSSAVDPSR